MLGYPCCGSLITGQHIPGCPNANKPLNDLAKRCHAAAHVWHHDLATGAPIERNKGEMIALMHSELSEMLEGERKNLMDSHLPHRKSAEVELADLLIRAFDYAGKFDFDLDGAVAEKNGLQRTASGS